MRKIVWFSCGAASAVSAKLALNEGSAEIVYCDTGSEHPDNKRFLKDCEKWFGQKVIILKNEKYSDIWEVFNKTKWLVGPSGARCTTELKKKMRQNYERPDDIHVFGYTLEEIDRAERFSKNNFELKTQWNLIENNLNKNDCLALIERAGIELPVLYKLGYDHNNCLGCVKGQSGYWNKIRIDFIDVFNRMAKVERQLNVAINKTYEKGERKRIFLDELDPKAGNYKNEPDISCSLFCHAVSEQIK